MDSTQFMGMLIAAIVVLLGLVSTFTVLVIKPLINLNTSITKLNGSIDVLNCSTKTTAKKVEKNTEDIANIKTDIALHAQRLDNLENND